MSLSVFAKRSFKQCRTNLGPTLLALSHKKVTLFACSPYYRNLEVSSIYKAQLSFTALFSKIFKNKSTNVGKIPKKPSFYLLSQSPIKAIVEKGKIISEHGVCPICDQLEAKNSINLSNQTDSSANPPSYRGKKPTFECPGCGYPTHCSEEHWKLDQHHKTDICSHLKTANIDEHDLRSGRKMPEFEFPASQAPELIVNLSNWDTYFYTRNFLTIKSNQAVRHVSKILTYPITIASIIHPYSPFAQKKAFTPEGIKSIGAIQTTLREHELAKSDQNLASLINPIRIFVLGARSEAMLPVAVYLQLYYLIPSSLITIYFVGPECIPSPDESRNTVAVSSRLVLKYHKGLFHDMLWSFAPFDPYTDIFFMFNPGVGHPLTKNAWKPTIEKLLETKCGIFATGFSDSDMSNDIDLLNNEFTNKFDWLLKPTPNPFSSLKRDFAINDLRVWAQSNMNIYGFRGKLYEVEKTQ
ncbi:hypothetical protein BB561_000163 [Smittium simulii]|uniref:Uncharacterized protein n=1 Tax=Smittium simulii TaxID=133385 RepID=A0A2T9Z0B1_9FUNG|nr:hypothetical protein BB561_000163 [Smittium simulii]